MKKILKILLVILIYSTNSSGQISFVSIQNGVFQINGPEQSFGTLNTGSVGFDFNKAQGELGLNLITSLYSQTTYDVVEFFINGDYKLVDVRDFYLSGGILLGYKVSSFQSFQGNTILSGINKLDVRPSITFGYSNRLLSPYFRVYRGLLNLETKDSESFMSQQFVLGFKWNLAVKEDE